MQATTKGSYKLYIVIIFWTMAIIIVISVIYTLPPMLHQETLQTITQMIQLPTPLIQNLPVPAAKLLGYIPTPKGEPYHHPQSFCNLPIDHYKNNSNITYHNHFPHDITIDEIITKRTEPIENIPMCPNANIKNYNQHKNILSKLPSNLIPYTNRCKINAIGRGKRQFGGLLSGDPLIPHLSTQIGFLHVYKAGGTTVRDTMNNILPGLGRTIWHYYRYHIREFMSHLFMFAHVRDPVTRAISSYFELHRRNETDLVKNHMIGIDSFRYLLSMMTNRMDCSLANKDKMHKMHDYTVGNIFFNMHLMPQMYFLTEAVNPWRAWPVNYVGNMSELSESTFEILYHFYWNTSDYLQFENKTVRLGYEEALAMFNKKYHHGRDRHKKKYLDGGERKGRLVGDNALLYQLEMDDLSDDDIRQICDIYWMDYLCIPFPIPTACNLTQLLLRHYGDDVVYKDCWEYNTQEWNQKFASKYKDKTKLPRARRKNGNNVNRGSKQPNHMVMAHRVDRDETRLREGNRRAHMQQFGMK